MKVSFEITGLEPPTLNHTHKIAINRKTKKRFPKKTPSYERYESVFLNKMRLYKSDVNKLNKYFDEKIHCLHIDYRFYIPVNKKNGQISKTSKDVDNLIKATQDVLFKNFLFDDAFVLKVSSEKIHSEILRVEVDVRVLPAR